MWCGIFEIICFPRSKLVVCVLLYVEGHTYEKYGRFARECTCSRLRRETHGWAEVEHLDTSLLLCSQTKTERKRGRKKQISVLQEAPPPPELDAEVRTVCNSIQKTRYKKERKIRKSFVLQKTAPRA